MLCIVQVRRLFWLTVQDHLSVWNLRLRSAKLSCRRGIPVSKVVRLLPRYCSVIIIRRGNYRLLSIAMCLSCLTLKIITWPEELTDICRMCLCSHSVTALVIPPLAMVKPYLTRMNLQPDSLWNLLYLLQIRASVTEKKWCRFILENKEMQKDLSKPCVLSSVYLFRQERPLMWSLTWKIKNWSGGTINPIQ